MEQSLRVLTAVFQDEMYVLLKICNIKNNRIVYIKITQLVSTTVSLLTPLVLINLTLTLGESVFYYQRHNQTLVRVPTNFIHNVVSGNRA